MPEDNRIRSLHHRIALHLGHPRLNNREASLILQRFRAELRTGTSVSVCPKICTLAVGFSRISFDRL